MRGSDQRRLQAGFAVGQRRQHRIGHVEAHLREGESQDREVDPRAAQRDIADDQREEATEQGGEQDAGQDVHRQQFEHPDGRIAADAEEGGMTEGEISGQAEQDVEADREDREDRDALHQVGIARVELGHGRAFGEGVEQDRGGEREQRHDDQEGQVFSGEAEHGLVLHHAGATHQAARTCQDHDDGDDIDDDLVDARE